MIPFLRYHEEARIFQTQLAALLDEGVPLEEAVRRIELKADPVLAELIRSAMGPGALTDGLVRAGLLHADLAGLSGTAFRAHFAKEARATLVQRQVQRNFARVFWFLGLMGAFAVLIYGFFQFRVAPMLIEMQGYYEPAPARILGATPVAATVMFFTLIALGIFLAFLGAIYMAITLPSRDQWRQFGFLWKVPGLAGLFRKQVTWKVFSSLQFLLGAGEPAGDAMAAVLQPFGLKPTERDGAVQFPETKLLDANSVRAANLGASLDTLPRQLEISIEALQYDLPLAAQGAARAVYYAGYVLLGVLVGSMLVQMYEPIFSLAGLI